MNIKYYVVWNVGVVRAEQSVILNKNETTWLKLNNKKKKKRKKSGPIIPRN